MAERAIELDGSERKTALDDEGSFITAPGYSAKGRVTEGQFEEHLNAMSIALKKESPNSLLDALKPNDCWIRRVIELTPDHPYSNSPATGTHQLRSKTDDGIGSILRVVHEKGHISWHLPQQSLTGQFQLQRVEGGWNFLIPHVPPPANALPGPFGETGTKVITEIAFHFLQGSADSLLKDIVAKVEGMLVPEGLLQIYPASDPPFGPLNGAVDILADTKVLLLIHGTASSSRGAFQKMFDDRLWSTPFFARYGRAVAYNHHTLSKSPDENSADLVRQLSSGFRRNGHSLSFDVLTHSRGGLVGRNVVELPPTPATSPAWATVRGEWRKLAMVGTPNSGTPLADAGQMLPLINTTSNLMGGAADWLFGLKFGLFIAALRYLAHGFYELPGIKAQAPGSDYLALLNGPPDSQPVIYGIARADFKAEAFLLRFLNSLWTNKVFSGVPNDLVVPYASVGQCDPTQPFAQSMDHQGSDIHHLNYFAHEATKSFLNRIFS